MRLTFPFGHAFLCGKVRVEEKDQAEPCIIEFGDGAVLIGAAASDGDDVLLDVPAYRTARGNKVTPESWRLTRASDGVWRTERRG